MSDLLRAADAIDALADALPEDYRRQWHHRDLGLLSITGDDGADDVLASLSTYGESDEEAAICNHIAAVASPDRVRALTALLRAIDTIGPLDQLGDRYDHNPLGLVIAVDRIGRAAEHLARLYVGSQP